MGDIVASGKCELEKKNTHAPVSERQEMGVERTHREKKMIFQWKKSVDRVGAKRISERLEDGALYDIGIF